MARSLIARIWVWFLWRMMMRIMIQSYSSKNQYFLRWIPSMVPGAYFRQGNKPPTLRLPIKYMSRFLPCLQRKWRFFLKKFREVSWNGTPKKCDAGRTSKRSNMLSSLLLLWQIIHGRFDILGWLVYRIEVFGLHGSGEHSGLIKNWCNTGFSA